MSIRILAIESSCDETSAAVIEDGRTIRSNIIYSQIATHRAYGGVVPEIASREHLQKITSVVTEALAQSGLRQEELNAIAVTAGPGLVGSLLVGLSYGKAMALALDIPLIGVHHLMGHIYGGLLSHPDLKPPLVALVVSGGHSSLLYMPEHLHIEILGETRDDAAGEALDKIARTLGLPYPGGAALECLAEKGDPAAIDFPRAWLGEDSFDFSFSGLKSSVLNYMNRCRMKGEAYHEADIAASFQTALFEVLTKKAVRACAKMNSPALLLAGGVAANGNLRRMLAAAAAANGIKMYAPAKILCTDNGAMIGAAAHQMYLKGQFSDSSLNATPYLPLA